MKEKIWIQISEDDSQKFIDWAIKNRIKHKIYTYQIGMS